MNERQWEIKLINSGFSIAQLVYYLVDTAGHAIHLVSEGSNHEVRAEWSVDLR